MLMFVFNNCEIIKMYYMINHIYTFDNSSSKSVRNTLHSVHTTEGTILVCYSEQSYCEER